MSNSNLTPPAATATADDELPISAVYAALANERRRQVLSILVTKSTPIDIGTLARIVAAQENNTSYETVSEEHVKRARTMLHHCHLPKLTDLSMIEYNQEEYTVEELTADISSIFEGLSTRS